MIIIVMGVAGVGKTTVGAGLAEALGWRLVDADDLHPPANVEKMRHGQPLSDADREPWLAAVGAVIARALGAGESLVVACSALKAAYRLRLGGNDPRVRFVHLQAPRTVLAARLAARTGHFAGASLLDSQLADLETPPAGDALVVDGTWPPARLVTEIRRALDI
jgi:gluconokinase